MGRERVLLVWVVAVLIIIMVGVGESKYMVYNTSQGIVADKLNVHLVAHSHDDVGWLKTVDQYYVGSNNSIQGACVQNVLDSLIPALLADKNRKFIYVEQAFFQRWWRDQSEAMQLVVKKLVNSGQLEFINGGMCMHDEGPTHYIDMIDQTTLGHLFIKVEFNVTPRVGWQIDPFGHSAVQAYLLGAEVGFDSFFYGRIDYQDRAKRKSEKSLEVIWRGSKSLGSSSQIFAGAFPENYEPPSGFYFEVNDASPVVQDDPELFDYNVQERVNDFVAAAVAQANITRTNHIMWTMGTDFKYQYAHTWFRQLDKLIHYVNMSVRGGSGKSSFFSFSSLLTVITRDIKNITRSRDGRVNALYSTPSIYTDAKYATNQSWPIKTDDFFPYADRENAYWTGYFTSRPALKRYIRVLSGYYLAARQLEFFKGRSKLTNTDSLGDALAIAQHHDAVTGTEKQHVANDYAKRLSIGYKESEQLVSSSLACFVEPELECRNPATKFQQCPLLNVSYCPASEVQLSQGKILIVVIYNSLGWKREEVIQIPVISEDVIVHNSEGKEIESQLLPLVDTYVSLRNYYVKAYSGQTPVQTPKYWLAFPVSVPPLGFSSYVISNAKRPGSGSTKSSVHTFQIIESSTVEVGHGNLKLTFSRDHGKLTNYINSQSLVEETVKQSYVFYTGYNGTNDKAPQNAGAYIFRPNGTFLIKPEEEVSSTIMRGPITDEVHQRINPWIYQVTRLHKGKEHVEVEYIVGPIPINDGTGKDVVTQVMTNVDSNKTFYTDSNGRDFIKRIRDYRADWDLKVNQPVAGNYYPLNLGIYIRDDKKEFSVLVDRPVGGSSIVDGQIELMLHRRLLLDDSRGVAEALNETVCVPNDCKGLIIQGKLYYRIDPRGEGAKWRRSFGQEIYSPLLFAFSEQEGDNWINSHRPTFSWIDSSYSLPDNVAIITLQELDGGKVLLRLAHLYEIGEDKDLSVLTNVELKKLFPRKKISKVTETSLTANQERIEMEKKRLVWKVEGPSSQNDAEVKRGRPVDPASLIVELVPMEIRTFIIQFVSNPLSSI